MQTDAVKQQREPPFPDEATHVAVNFIPEVWSNGQAVASDDTEDFLVPIEDAITPEGNLPADRCEASDTLHRHDNAPDRAVNWPDIFSVELKALVNADGEPTVIEELGFLFG